MIENFRLRVFRAVASQLSFRKAGEILYLTQPAITLQIKSLEEEIGLQLFERRAGGVRLTEAGRVLEKYAAQLHGLSCEAEQALASLKATHSGELIVGASKTIAQYILPSRLAEFARLFGSVQIQVFSLNTEQVCEGVASGRFGLGLIEAPPQRRDIRVEPWMEDEILVAIPAGHEWAATSTIDVNQITTVPLILRERGSGLRSVVEHTLQRAKVTLNTLRVVMELDSSDTILACVEAGLGIGFASEWAFQNRPGLASLRFREQSMRRSFSFALPLGPLPSVNAALMVQLLRGQAGGAAPAS